MLSLIKDGWRMQTLSLILQVGVHYQSSLDLVSLKLAGACESELIGLV